MEFDSTFKKQPAAMIVIVTFTLSCCSGSDDFGISEDDAIDDDECETEILTDDERIDVTLAQHYLNVHNAKREEYCLAPLTWDCNLAVVAQNYAEQGAWYLPHNPNRNEQYATLIGCEENCPDIGENIHWHAPWDFFPMEGCLGGYLDEEDPADCTQGGLHYLQIVRPHATAMGCGLWIDSNDELHQVCNYRHDEGTFPQLDCSGSCN